LVLEAILRAVDSLWSVRLKALIPLRMSWVPSAPVLVAFLRLHGLANNDILKWL